MKLWFNEFLQNAAFPAMVLAFATSLTNMQIRDVRTGRSTDYRKAVRTQVSYIDPMMEPAAEKSYFKIESRNVTNALSPEIGPNLCSEAFDLKPASGQKTRLICPF